MTKLARIDAYYADSYEECEEPTADEVNAYLQDGNTLIISAVRNNRATIEQRKEKIKWLIQLGADVNKRDCSRRYFPALSHAVQMKDYEMFMFLLLECKASLLCNIYYFAIFVIFISIAIIFHKNCTRTIANTTNNFPSLSPKRT